MNKKIFSIVGLVLGVSIILGMVFYFTNKEQVKTLGYELVIKEAFKDKSVMDSFGEVSCVSDTNYKYKCSIQDIVKSNVNSKTGKTEVIEIKTIYLYNPEEVASQAQLLEDPTTWKELIKGKSNVKIVFHGISVDKESMNEKVINALVEKNISGEIQELLSKELSGDTIITFTSNIQSGVDKIGITSNGLIEVGKLQFSFNSVFELNDKFLNTKVDNTNKTDEEIAKLVVDRMNGVLIKKVGLGINANDNAFIKKMITAQVKNTTTTEEELTEVMNTGREETLKDVEFLFKDPKVASVVKDKVNLIYEGKSSSIFLELDNIENKTLGQQFKILMPALIMKNYGEILNQAKLSIK